MVYKRMDEGLQNIQRIHTALGPAHNMRQHPVRTTCPDACLGRRAAGGAGEPARGEVDRIPFGLTGPGIAIALRYRQTIGCLQK